MALQATDCDLVTPFFLSSYHWTLGSPPPFTYAPVWQKNVPVWDEILIGPLVGGMLQLCPLASRVPRQVPHCDDQNKTFISWVSRLKIIFSHWPRASPGGQPLTKHQRDFIKANITMVPSLSRNSSLLINPRLQRLSARQGSEQFISQWKYLLIWLLPLLGQLMPRLMKIHVLLFSSEQFF